MKHLSEQQVTKLQKNLNYCFNDSSLLIKSLTHSSYANENVKNNTVSNERLEFLGDSLLGMTVALLIYKRKPELTEGQMTKLRAELVCEKSLADLAMELDLGSYLLLGRGEENGGGRDRPSILSNTFEAVLAAIYLDGGYKPVEQLVFDHFNGRMDAPDKNHFDHKTKLQEIVQVNPGQSLVYKVTDEHGPDHDKSFIVEVLLNGKAIGTGSGKSKKRAEQEAAKAAINIVRE